MAKIFHEHSDSLVYYIFPSDYLIYRLVPELVATPIKVVLDSQERTLFMPRFSCQEAFVAEYLSYTLESPATPGKTIIYLSEVGRLQLVTRHANYNWELVCESCLNVDTITFTDIGVRVRGVEIHLLKGTRGNYYFHSHHAVYKLDWDRKQVILLEINAAAVRNTTRLLNEYLKTNTNSTPQNLLVKIDNYLMENNEGKKYNGTAFYSRADDQYFYSHGLPDKALLAPYKKMDASISVPTQLQVNFIGCIQDLCYFWAPYNYFWSSHRNTHQIVSKYHINAKEITTAFIVADHSVHIETSLDIYPKKAYLNGDAPNYFERRITYYVKPDGELYLASLSDSNDHLLQLFEDDNGESLSQTITHFVSEDWEIRGHFHEEDRNHFIASEGWEVREASHEENAEGERVQQHFAHRLNQFVSILPSSQNSSHYTPLWIRAQNETHYQRINPGIPEKNLLCLGSLMMKNRTEVLYFYKPASRLLTDEIASPQTERTGKLFLKSGEAVPAKALDFPILSAFSDQKKIFVVTTEHLIEVLDAAGKSHLTAITADWINAHLENWWTEIPILVESRVTETAGLITIYGFQDQSGNALAMWYDSKLRSFIFVQLPVNEQNKALSIRYLTRQGGFNFFFCEETGSLYQARSYTGALNEIFNGTQLQITLSDWRVLVTSLKTLYFQNKRWILEMQGGNIISSRFLPANHWTLEKIGKTCFHQCEIDNSTFPERTRDENNRFQRSLLNLDALFNKDCFNEKSLFFPLTRLGNNTLAAACSMANVKLTDVEAPENVACVTVNPTKPILVDMGSVHQAWIPQEARYFFNIYDKTMSSWDYLGLCKQTVRQTWLGACFFSKEDRMIYFAPRDDNRNTQAFWNRHNKNQTRMQVEFAQKQGKDQVLFVINVDRPHDPEYANEHFIPLLAEVKTLGLLLENTTPNIAFKIHKVMLKHYDKIVFYQSPAAQNTHLYFPSLLNEYYVDIKQEGTDVILHCPYFNSQWVFVNAMDSDSFTKTQFSFKNIKFKRKLLETQNEDQVIDSRSSHYETLATIRQLFSQYPEKNITLRYEIVVSRSQSVQHYQSAGLTQAQPAVKVQSVHPNRNKAFWYTNHVWWVVGAGTSFFSVAALVASARYGFIRRQDPNRENFMPLVTMAVAATTVATPLLPEAQAYEVAMFKKLATYSGFSEQHDCIKSNTWIGLLGFCKHENGIIYWHQAEKNSTIYFERYSVNSTRETMYLRCENKGEWKLLDLNTIPLVPLNAIQQYLPPYLDKRLAEQKNNRKF